MTPHRKTVLSKEQSNLTKWRWFVASSNLSGNAKGFLQALSLYMNTHTLECWPSESTLKKASGHSLSTVKRCIKIARKAGFIETTWRPTKGATGKSGYFYRGCFQQDSVSVTPDKTYKVSQGHRSGVTQAASRCHSDPLTSVNNFVYNLDVMKKIKKKVGCKS